MVVAGRYIPGESARKGIASIAIASVGAHEGQWQRQPPAPDAADPRAQAAGERRERAARHAVILRGRAVVPPQSSEAGQVDRHRVVAAVAARRPRPPHTPSPGNSAPARRAAPAHRQPHQGQRPPGSCRWARPPPGRTGGASCATPLPARHGRSPPTRHYRRVAPDAFPRTHRPQVAKTRV